MKSWGKRVLILALAFTAVTIYSSKMLSAPEETVQEVGSAMETGTLPVLYIQRGEQQLGPWFGYTEDMAIGCQQDCLIPFDERLSLSAELNTAGKMIAGITYEVRSEDGERLLQKEKIRDWTEDGETIQFPVQIPEVVQSGERCRLQMDVTISGGIILHYYAWGCRIDEQQADRLFGFAEAFHNAAFDKTQMDQYKSYLETDEDSGTNSLQHVTIHSPVNQLTWGSLAPQQVSDTWVEVQSWDGSHASFAYRYLIQADTESGLGGEFFAEENFTLQDTGDSIRLLKYDRTLNQVFQPNEANVPAGSMILGIQDRAELSEKTSNNKDFCVFAVSGDLWACQYSTKKLTRVYTVGQEGNTGIKLCQPTGIRVTGVSDEGRVHFLVYGYLGTGEREGQNGLAYMEYDMKTQTLRERFFLASDRSFEVLRQELGTMLYENEREVITLCHNGNLYNIDGSGGEIVLLAENVEEKGLLVKKDSSCMVWNEDPDGDGEADAVQIMNLQTGTRYLAEAEDGEFIRAIGFVRDDLVLGRGQLTGPVLQKGFTQIRPLDQVQILNPNYEVVSDYQQENTVFPEVRAEDGRVEIERMAVRSDGSFQPLVQDVLLSSNKEAADGGTEIEVQTHAVLQQILCIESEKQVDYSHMIPSKQEIIFFRANDSLPEAVYENDASAETPQSEEGQDPGAEAAPQPHITAEKEVYYGYSSGHLKIMTQNAGACIRAVDEEFGYVTDADGRLVWVRKEREYPVLLNPGFGGRVYEAEQRLEGCARGVLGMMQLYEGSGIDLTEHTLQETLEDNGVLHALNLSGCTFRQLIYFLEKGEPVIWNSVEDGARILIGFNGKTTYSYDPLTGETESIALSDMENRLSSSGSSLIGCQKP